MKKENWICQGDVKIFTDVCSEETSANTFIRQIMMQETK